MPVYQVQKELKARARKAGLTVRDLAHALQEPPATTSNRLNGWLPFSEEQRKTLEQSVSAAEARVHFRPAEPVDLG